MTVDDDETVSIVLSKTDLTVEEEDATGGTYTVKLSHEPSEEVTVTVTGQDTTDLTLSGLSGTDTLTFSTTTWDDAQTVTVKAGEDADAKNDSVTLTHTGAGGEYEGVAEELAVTVDDDETLGVVISPTALTVQAGGSNSYTVVLGSLPSGDVTVTLSGHEGAVLSLAGIDNDNALTFTQDNWHAPQTVSVSADAEAQSSTITIEHSVASADDPDYAAAAAPDVAVSVLGAPDTIQIQVGVATSVQELEVPEGGANTYSMVLSHQPSGDVTVTVNNPTDNSEVTATPRTLTFTTENWHAPQTVTVAAVHDGDAADDSATVTHGVADGGYNGVTVPDVAVTVDDDETVSIVLSKTDLTVEEEDATGGTYTVKLSHEPSEEVTVTVTGQDTTDLTLSGLSGTDTLTFSTTTWDDAQTVTVKAGEDADAKNDSVTLTHTATGGEYASVSADLAVTVDDDETVSIVLSKTDLTVEEEDATGETYTVKLSHEPSVEVTVTVSGQDTTDLELTGLGEGETLTFTTSTWDDAQTVTVKAGEDADAKNDSVTLTHTGAGGEYKGVAEELAVTVDDDETVSIVLSKTDLTVEEEDATGGTYTVKLSHEPSEEVTVTVTGQDTTDLTLSGLSGTDTLTFSTTTWDDAQTVTVKAGEDADAKNDSVTLTHTATGGEYASVSADLAVTVDDDETVSIVLSKTDLTVEEEDATGGTYTVKLSHEPSVEVTVTVTGQDTTDLTLSGLSGTDTLTFSTTTWDDAQTVTVKAREDADAKNDSVTLTHTGAGGEYEGVAEELAVTVDDDETVSVVLSKTDLTVEEEDATGGTYTVKLSHEPSEEVTVTVTGHDQTDLELSGLSGTDTLTFSTTTWDDAQTVTVKAGEDADAKNDSVTLTHTATGGEYASVSADLAVTVDDDETVSIVLSKTDLTVEEEDATGGTYTVKLSHEPSVEVTVTVTGQDTTDLTLSGLSGTDTLTFSTTTWDDAQTVTVKAGEDADAKNDSVTLTHTGAGGEYEGVAEELAVTVDDDETLGVVISPTALTVQAGGSNSYTVVLGSLPSGDVTVTLSGHEGAVLSLAGIDNDNALTFTQDNWHAPQTVSVSADAEAQSSTITIEHSVASADDPDYAAAAAPDVAVSVLGAPDTIQIQVGVATSVQELEVPEGGANTYSMVLSHQPSGDVTVTVNNPTDNSEVTATPRTLTFTTENWHAPQTVTVAAVHDGDAADDSATVTHGVADGGYNGVTVPDVAVTVDDDETVSIVLSKTDLTVEEEDATGGTYTVKLSHEPSEEVTVTVTGQDTTDLTLSGLSGTDTLTFSTTTWDDAQTVTVKAGEDADAKNDSVTLTHTGAGRRVRQGVADLAVTVDDDETVSIVLSKTDLTVEEEDATGGTYTVKLSHEPSEEVTVTVTGQDTTDLTLSGLSGTDTLTFSTTTWDDAQTVTVKAGEDADAKNDSVTLTHTGAGGEYKGVAEELAVTVDDDETVSVVLSKTDLTVEEEDATGGTYTVKLSHEPSVEVTVTVTGQDTTDLTLSGLSGTDTLTFSTTTWDDAQTVTVKAGEDTDAANDKVTLTHAATGGEYEGVSSDLAVTVDDDETVSIVLSKTDLTVEEEDATGETYTVKLSHEPSVEVTVTVSGQDTTDLELTGLGEGETLTFTTSTWDDAQTVTVKAGEDADAKNDSVTLTHTGAGGEYKGVAEELAVTVDDDETVSIVLSKTDLTVEEEDATGGTYTVKLSHEPSVEVTVTVTGQDTTDLTLSGLSGTDTLTFSTTTWDDAQTVTVKAGEDADAKNDSVTLTHTGAGGEYEGVAEELAVTVDDDETLGVVISPTALTVQAGGSNSYTVVLGSLPSGDVTVTLSGHEGAVLSLAGIDNDNALTFTQDNWHAPQTVSVSADAEAQSSTITIEHSVASADDPDYAAAAAPDVAVSVLGAPDTIQIQVGVATSVQELEVPEGGANTYSMVLSHQPSGDVTVTVNNPTDNSEVTATPRTLTFTTENWHAPQTVTVAAVHDGDAADDSATVTHGVADGGYNGVTVPDVAVTVDDDETVSIVLSKTDLTVEEEDATGGTYTVKLSHEPSEEVTVTVTGQDTTDLTLSGLHTTFSDHLGR